jgi:hypothetical protein
MPPSRVHDRCDGASTRRARAAGCALALALVAVLVTGCIGGKRHRGPYEDQAKSNAAAIDRLAFGMGRAEAAAVMGEQRIVPPWANDRGIGPQVLRNPFDSAKFESPEGEAYEVDRYVTGLFGQSGCPFIRGEAELVPLIFLDGELVGWRWSYLESVLQRGVRPDERSWSFGEFCSQASEIPD